MARRGTLVAFVGGGLVVALLFAFFVSPYASSKPDGLEKVSIDKGFDGSAKDSATADSPLADYSVKGVDNEKLSTGLAGVIGVGLCFALCAGAFFGVRTLRRRDESPPTAGSAGLPAPG
jgi:hypothetical protein